MICAKQFDSGSSKVVCLVVILLSIQSLLFSVFSFLKQQELAMYYDPKVSQKNNLTFNFMNFNDNFINRNENVEQISATKSPNMLKMASNDCFKPIAIFFSEVVIIKNLKMLVDFIFHLFSYFCSNHSLWLLPVNETCQLTSYAFEQKLEK